MSALRRIMHRRWRNCALTQSLTEAQQVGREGEITSMVERLRFDVGP